MTTAFGVLFTGCDSNGFEPESLLPRVVGFEKLDFVTPAGTIDVSPPIESAGAVPSKQQLEWQQSELHMFVHFGVNTFTGNEWGTGKESPSVFNPSSLDALQWVSVAKEIGFGGIIFTTKHHDGFALWPTAQSSHSVSSSPWKNGTGDVVREISSAAGEAGIKFGIYLSPWDRHESTYSTPAYNDFYVNQLSELLTNYGDIYEVWLDGAREPGLPDPGYDTGRWFRTIYQHQPEALIFGGPDLRWVGNETGNSPGTQWSAVSEDRWFPAECDTPNRPGWFWRASEDARVKTADELLEIYYSSVGRNCTLLLNVPVNNRGTVSEPDIKALRGFRKRLDSIFDVNLLRYGQALGSSHAGQDDTDKNWAAQNVIDGKDATFWVAEAGKTTGWIEIQLPGRTTFNVISLMEPIQYGQRIARYEFQAWDDVNEWVTVASGSTIGYKKLDQLPVSIRARRVRLKILESRGVPAILKIGVHLDSD
jgi:alpha-L-fucosidase